MKIGITCYPTYGGSGVVAPELGLELGLRGHQAHIHYAIPHSVSAMLARQMLAASGSHRKLPFVTTLHGTDITLVGLDRSYLPITRFSIEQSDGVTAISQYLQERTLREFDIRNEIKVIHNFVNCDVYRCDPDREQHRLE